MDAGPFKPTTDTWVKEQNGGRGRGLIIALILVAVTTGWWVTVGHDWSKPFFMALDYYTVGWIGWGKH